MSEFAVFSPLLPHKLNHCSTLCYCNTRKKKNTIQLVEYLQHIDILILRHTHSPCMNKHIGDKSPGLFSQIRSVRQRTVPDAFTQGHPLLLRLPHGIVDKHRQLIRGVRNRRFIKSMYLTRLHFSLPLYRNTSRALFK